MKFNLINFIMDNCLNVKSALFLFVVFLMIGFSTPTVAQEDYTHFSETFNREKPYRIFLPNDYATSQNRYPVIYYLHGNTGSHEFDKDGVVKLVNDNSVLLVAWK